jgi:hypothetical protein
MGVDSNLLINAKYNVKDVVKVLTGLGIKISREEHKGDHSFLVFDLESLVRTLYVARSTEYGGLDGTVLSFGSNEEGIALLKKIAAVTGGFLREGDCDNNWESIDSPHESNVDFVLKHTILTKAIADGQELCEKVAKSVGYE